MTKELLQKCMPNATPANIEKYGDRLIAAMKDYNIIGPDREAAFIAQIAHESGSLKYVAEIASGDAYEGRASLGNTEPGDGKRFKGRGLIQITGRFNYQLVGRALNYDFISKPEDLERPGPACYSAAWFWWYNRLNRLADIEAFEMITRRINGGLNGYSDRVAKWEHCKQVLGAYAEHKKVRDIDEPLPS